MMKKILTLIILAGLGGVSATVLAGYTTYSSTAGYTQPRYRYVPYYHGNRDYEYQSHDRQYDQDIRRNASYHIADNTVTHSDTYNIYADRVDIDNHYYYGNYGPRRQVDMDDIDGIFHNLPAPEQCKTDRHRARGDDYFGNVGLRIPSSLASITKYRVRWSDGQWSQRYTPGNDVDDSSIAHRHAPRRMRAYFGIYEHEITTCTARVAGTYQQSNYYYSNRRGVQHETDYRSRGLRTLPSRSRRRNPVPYNRGSYTTSNTNHSNGSPNYTLYEVNGNEISDGTIKRGNYTTYTP